LTVDTCKDENIFPLVAQEMARVHSSIPLDLDQQNSAVWEKAARFIELADEIMESDKKITSVYVRQIQIYE